MRPKILVDSNFLYALFRPGDPYHPVATNVVRAAGADFIVPQVVLTEAAFLFNRAGGMPLVAAFVDLLEMPIYLWNPLATMTCAAPASCCGATAGRNWNWWTAASSLSLNA